MRDRPIESDEQFLDYMAINMLGGADFAITTSTSGELIVRQASLVKPGATPDQNEIIIRVNEQLTDYFRNTVLARIRNATGKRKTDMATKKAEPINRRGNLPDKKEKRKVEF
jgi:hypothetical protein